MKYYQSERWLRNEYYAKRRTPEQIAETCGVSRQTIYLWLKKFNMK